jgi:tripartite-type tricarboxylate transporter receptor subunit TctC
LTAGKNLREEKMKGSSMSPRGRRCLLFALACIGVLALSTASGRGEDAYPSQTVKLVVPAAAGSTTDTLARLMAEHFTRKWGKSAVVENIAGGGMNTGSERVARSASDGYTLLVAPPGPITLHQLLFRQLGYDPTQWVAVTMLAKISNVLVVRKELPVSSVKDLIAYAKANPGKLSYASQGPGSTAHLSASQLEVLAGIKMVHVPYRGAVLALNDIVAGHVDLFFDTLTTSVPLYRADKVKILAVAGLTRAAAVPEIPTMAEAGLPGFRSITWFAIVAPPGTPGAIAAKLNRDAVEILQRKEITDRLRELSLEVGATSQADTAKFFAEETALWSKVIKESNIQPQ